MSAEPPRSILVVDDEPQITRVLRTSLTSRGYEVQTAANGLEALQAFERRQPDLVITDLAMPEMTGVELCRRIRSLSETPIIVLSVRAQEEIKISALDAGADDYVTKPFSIQELLARVRAQLRRVTITSPTEPETLSLGDFVIDFARHRVTVREEEVHLTPKQFELMAFFARNPGRVLTHRVLLRAVWGVQATDQPEHLRVAINQIRKRLGEDTDRRYIYTEPWLGYRFCPDGDKC